MIINSKIIPIRIKDVDTDLIIPADYLKGTSTIGLGQHLFQRLCDSDPDFALNLPEYAEAQVIVARDNFGCGSSREHAAWALKEWGIRVVIAPSFADIFKTNTLKNGVLLVALNEVVVEDLLEHEYEVVVNLADQEVRFNGKVHVFEIDDYRKECLLKGMSDLDYLLSQMSVIEKFDQARKEKLFFKIES